jgi:hypothetical protein
MIYDTFKTSADFDEETNYHQSDLRSKFAFKITI